MARPKKIVDGKTLIPEMVKVAVGTMTLGKAARQISKTEKESLSRAIKMDVDEWRKEFGQQLRETAQELLEITRRDLEKIKPDARAYTIAVLVDKSTAIENRAPQNTFNQQINHFHGMTKEQLLEALAGPKPVTPLNPSQIAPQSKETAQPLIVAEHSTETLAVVGNGAVVGGLNPSLSGEDNKQYA